MLKNYRNKAIFTVGLLWFSMTAYSQDTPLTSWQFSTALELSDEVVQDTRSEALFLEDFLLVTHPNLDSEDECGEVLLLVENPVGEYIHVNKFSAQDFGRSCIEQDGFGFSVAYAEGLLVIGAPGQVFIEQDGSLTRGAVYIYNLNSTLLFSGIQSITPQARVAGTFAFGNVAWGTRVETDGERILVQGNTKGDADIAHGRAISRTVNLLENQTGETWAISQQFTDDSTFYGQDFRIKDNQIFINKHTFNRFDGGTPNRPATALHDSEVEIYTNSLNSDGYNLTQSISFENFFPVELAFTDNEGISLQDIDQIFIQGDRLVLFRIQRGIFNRFSEIAWYEESQSGQFEQIATQPFLIDSIDIEEDPVGIDGIAIFESDHIGRGTLSGYELGEQFAQLDRRQIIAGRRNQPIENIDYFSLNARNTRLLLATGEPGMQQLSVFAAVPTLDPAITGLWWFGQQFDGQGVTLEVLVGNRLLMHWFTYDLSGNQMWVRGVGELVDGSVQMQLVRGRGPSFPVSEFDPDDRLIEPWGMAEISFEDCKNGRLTYQSDEFGSDSLRIVPVANNDFLCGRGFITSDAVSPRRSIAGMYRGFGFDSVIGSSFDPSRAGEGIILMPAGFDVQDNVSRTLVGLWLTYDLVGNQAWYYLGLSEACFVGLCRWQLVDQPRRPLGPEFGPAYDPDDRSVFPWGQFGPFRVTPGAPSGLSVDFDNPHGTGTLDLEKATRPVGY